MQSQHHKAKPAIRKHILCSLSITELYSVQSSKTFLRSAGPGDSSLKIVGSIVFPVKVYVKLNQNSPRILCVTNRLRNSELIDPVSQWHGPSGNILSENSSVKISPTGTLIFRHFKSSQSGVYACSLVYKLTAEQPVKNLIMKYLIYAYSDPNYYYEFTVRYHAAPCNSIYNSSFEKTLLQLLSQLVAELSCEVTLIKSECHHVKMQRAGLQNEIFFTFSVASLDKEQNNRPCQQSTCDTSERLSKARYLIENFFKQQAEITRNGSEPLPEIYYIEGTLQMVWVDRCYPGYGMNPVRHPDCPDCCVVCSPGSYNPSNGIHCLPCNKSFTYGATECQQL
ncbi:zona pellucida-binding protein 1 [Dromaius novaehollandiae]|uniref:zona pellucida-binding protein 1 n=1 Tax=Dromaius novaehollandiae TaxID=8790 RepID=UPI00311DA1E7